MCFLLLLLVTLASADKVVRELPAMHTNATIFQGSVANIHKTFQLALPLGNSKIVVNTADTIDPSSIQMTVIPKDGNVYKDVVVRSYIYILYSLTHSFIHAYIYSGKSEQYNHEFCYKNKRIKPQIYCM